MQFERSWPKSLLRSVELGQLINLFDVAACSTLVLGSNDDLSEVNDSIAAISP